MTRFIIGVCCILITFPLNHFDYLIPEFTGVTVFGNRYEIVEGLTSTDLIWTLIQKINIVLLCIAFFILLPFSKEYFKWSKLIIRTSISLIIVLNTYQFLILLYRYVNGFNDDMFFVTFLSLITVLIIIFLLIVRLHKYLLYKKHNKILEHKAEINKLKTEIQERLDSLYDTNLDITNKIEALESLPLFIKETDNMETWSLLAHRRAMMIYGQLNKQLKDLEKAKMIAV